jgi:hypothetical protein
VLADYEDRNARLKLNGRPTLRAIIDADGHGKAWRRLEGADIDALQDPGISVRKRSTLSFCEAIQWSFLHREARR